MQPSTLERLPLFMTLGNLGKPSADQFSRTRKLIMVPMIFATHSDSEFIELLNQYWLEALKQVRNLESRLGSVSYVFHEGGVDDGEAGLISLEKGSPEVFQTIKEICSDGAVLCSLEDTELLLETLDLQRCLMIAQASQVVQSQLREWFLSARKRRYDSIASRIDGMLSEDQMAVLFIGQGHQVQFPGDLQVFYVAPPSLDAIDRWVRENDIPMSSTDVGAAEPDTSSGNSGNSGINGDPNGASGEHEE